VKEGGKEGGSSDLVSHVQLLALKEWVREKDWEWRGMREYSTR